VGLLARLLGRSRSPIPPPSGPHAVGTTRYEVTAAGLLDPYSSTPTPRRVPVQAWYPAVPGTGRAPELYLDEALRAALSEVTKVPKFLLPKNPSKSAPDAAAAPGRYPVLVFNHGFGSFQKQSASLMEELASHGYVVLSVGHPSESTAVQYTDGTVVKMRSDLPAWKAITAGLKNLEANAREVAPWIEQARAARDPRTLCEAKRGLAAHPTYAVLLPVLEGWTRDTRAVLDQLPALDEGVLSATLRGLVDVDRLGLFGHSLGGILSGQLAMSDPRVKAGMSYDGAQLPPPGDVPYRLVAPFCFVYADTAKLGSFRLANESMNDALLSQAPPGSRGACLRGAAHLNFTDMNNVPMAARMLGSIERGEMARQLRAMTVGFFDHHLKGAPLRGFTPSELLQVTVGEKPRRPSPSLPRWASVLPMAGVAAPRVAASSAPGRRRRSREAGVGAEGLIDPHSRFVVGWADATLVPRILHATWSRWPATLKTSIWKSRACSA